MVINLTQALRLREITKSQTYTCVCGRHPVNAPKNRYNDIVPCLSISH